MDVQAVLFDLDFTLAKPGPDLGPEGYRLLGNRFGLDLDRSNREIVFAGDSPNDAPMFSFFECSIGVANIARFAGMFKPEPKYVTRGAAGAGFAELAAQLLAQLPESS